MSIKYKPYSELTDKQKDIFKNHIIGQARFCISVHYNDFYEKWDDGWEELSKEFENLVINNQYDKVYNFICKHEVIK